MEGKYGEIDGHWPEYKAEGSGKKMVDDPFLGRRGRLGGKRKREGKGRRGGGEEGRKRGGEEGRREKGGRAK